MTVSVQTNRDEFTGNGVTTDFATTFEFQTGTDLKVYLDGVLKTITTHYTVSGGAGSTGTVKFLVAPGNGLEVVIYDDPPVTQGTDYTPNDAFPAESHELALDKLTRIARTLKSRVDRAAVLSDFDTSGADTTLPTPSSRRAIVWNTAADGFENSTYDPDDAQTASAASAAAAAASASAAATSASNASTSATNAATSATNANTARVAAETAETNAETAETNAEAAAIAQGMPFVFDTTTAMADPGAGKIRFNNATLASATAIALDDADAETRDLSAYIATWDDSTNTNKGTLVVTKSGGAAFAIYTITGLTDNAGWTELAVTYVTGSGAINNTDRVYLGFSRTGNAGDASAASIQVQGYSRFTVGGTADAMTGTLSPAIAAYAARLRVTTTPGGANTVTGPTLNLNSLGAKTIKKRDSGGAKVALAAGDYNASGPFDFEYDGTDFILLNPVPAGLNFLAYRNTNQTGIATATWTKVQLNAEQWDSRSTFDSATNYRWTPGATGIAHVSLSAQFETATDGADLRVALYQNGSLYRASINYAVGTGQQTVTLASDVQVSAVTDYFEVYVYQATGSNRSLEQGADRTYFSGHML